MRAPADPIGESVRDKTRLEDWFHDTTESMMHDAVAKRCRRDDAPLRIAYLEGDVAPRPIAAVAKFAF